MNRSYVLNVMTSRIRTSHTYVIVVNETVQSMCHGRDEAELVDKYSHGLASKLEKLDLRAFKGTVYQASRI